MSTPFDAFSDEQNGTPYESAQDAEETLPVSEVAEPEITEPFPAPVSEAELESSASPLLSTLPPEAQGETNGGPLGCCLGTVAGLFLTLLVIMLISLAIGNGGYLGWTTLPVTLLGTIVGGSAGWIIGKRIYREYELSPERKKRLEFREQRWQSRQIQSNRMRHPKPE